MQLAQKHCLCTVSVTHTKKYQGYTLLLNILKVCPQEPDEFLLRMLTCSAYQHKCKKKKGYELCDALSGI